MIHPSAAASFTENIACRVFVLDRLELLFVVSLHGTKFLNTSNSRPGTAYKHRSCPFLFARSTGKSPAGTDRRRRGGETGPRIIAVYYISASSNYYRSKRGDRWVTNRLIPFHHGLFTRLGNGNFRFYDSPTISPYRCSICIYISSPLFLLLLLPLRKKKKIRDLFLSNSSVQIFESLSSKIFTVRSKSIRNPYLRA